MKFAMNPAPYLRAKRSTFQIMMELLLGLGVVWIAAIIYYFINGGARDGLLVIFNVIVCALACAVTEICFFIPSWRKEKDHNIKTLLKKEVNSFGYVSGVILALILPVLIDSNIALHYYKLIVTSIVSVGLLKMVFGGFGNNIFNPALIGRVFATVCFGANFQYGMQDNMVFAGPTELTNWASHGFTTSYINNGGANLSDLLFGNYRGTLGETFALIILIVGVILAIRKVIDWRIAGTYLLTCLISSLFVGLVNNVDVMTFTLGQMLSGGLIFGAVFCITDPVTSPTSPLGKIVFATGAGFLTMLIRIKGASAEGVAFSILTMNMLTPLIDKCFKGRTFDNLKKKVIITSVLCAVMLLISLCYVNSISKEEYVTGGPTQQQRVQIEQSNMEVNINE